MAITDRYLASTTDGDSVTTTGISSSTTVTLSETAIVTPTLTACSLDTTDDCLLPTVAVSTILPVFSSVVTSEPGATTANPILATVTALPSEPLEAPISPCPLPVTVIFTVVNGLLGTSALPSTPTTTTSGVDTIVPPILASDSSALPTAVPSDTILPSILVSDLSEFPTAVPSDTSVRLFHPRL
ncbi:hypothetical protein C0989_001452 [Termitomyces sp. Mn162]|nr:hypothetical protein C0989_001452 [Termitomyces sp. Mn162]